MAQEDKVSNSRLNSYRSCPRRYFYEYECRLEPIDEGETEHDRSFGDAIHLALAHLYLGGGIEEAKKKFNERYPVALDEEDLSKTPESGGKLIEVYWNMRRPQLADQETLMVEVLDEFEPAPGLTFRVKLDRVYRNKKYGGVYGEDWKTTGKPLNYRYWARFNPNSQIPTYHSYITKKFEPCSGFYIDAMSFGYRKRAYKGEPAGFHFNIDRQLFTQTKDQLDEWLDSEVEWKRLIDEAKVRNSWPMNTQSCQFCSFRPVCSAGWTWDRDKELIKAQFKEREASCQVEKSS